MIRDAVIHLNGEQPLLADLFELPTPTDAGMLCTNLRTMTRTRPIFVDHIDSVFFFPYRNVRFIEIQAGSDGAPDAETPALTGEAPAEERPDAELEIDEDFLRRIREA